MLDISYETNQIINIGSVCKVANPQVDTSDLEREIDQFANQLYGLTEDEIKIVES